MAGIWRAAGAVGIGVALGRAAAHLLGRRPSGTGRAAKLMPVNIARTPSAFLVRAVVPGIPANNLHVSVDGRALTITGRPGAPYLEPGLMWFQREHQAEPVSRTVLLPEPVQSSGAQAQYANGMLMLVLPRASAGAQPDSSRLIWPAQAHVDDRVEEASEESFPASDAPGWLPQRV